MNKMGLFKLVFLSALVLLITACTPETTNQIDSHLSIVNPAATYCQEMGYAYEITLDEQGAQKGTCTLPNELKCDAWDFLSGSCGQDYSYCAKNGYETRTSSDGQNSFTSEYAICVDKSGDSVGLATDLIQLEEKISGCGKDNTSDFPAFDSSTAKEGFVNEFPDAVLPISFDWRNNNGNWLTSVKDQGICGSCWAFASVGVTEAALKIAANNPGLNPDLSEQYLVSDCFAGSNCCGGYKSGALTYIKTNGIPDEACMAYVDGASCTCVNDTCATNCTYNCSDRICSNRCSDWSSRLKFLETTGYVGTDRTTIKSALTQKGPLAVSYSTTGYWDGDIYKCTNPTTTDHAVVIVGYNDAGSYWIVKNSWGSGWNGDGYFKVGYGQCKIEDYVYYATAKKPIPGSFSKTQPSNGSIGLPNTFLVSWSPSSLATNYEVCGDTINNNTCDDGWLNIGNATSVAVPPGYLIPNTTYYWQVRAINLAGTTYANGSSTAYWPAKTSALPANFNKISPVNATTNMSKTMTAIWSSSSAANSYEVCGDLSNNSLCDSPWINVGNVTSFTVPPGYLSPNTTYYWHVRALNSFGTTYSNGSSAAFWWGRTGN